MRTILIACIFGFCAQAVMAQPTKQIYRRKPPEIAVYIFDGDIRSTNAALSFDYQFRVRRNPDDLREIQFCWGARPLRCRPIEAGDFIVIKQEPSPGNSGNARLVPKAELEAEWEPVTP